MKYLFIKLFFSQVKREDLPKNINLEAHEQLCQYVFGNFIVIVQAKCYFHNFPFPIYTINFLHQSHSHIFDPFSDKFGNFV